MDKIIDTTIDTKEEEGMEVWEIEQTIIDFTGFDIKVNVVN